MGDLIIKFEWQEKEKSCFIQITKYIKYFTEENRY